uniref:Cytokine dependent hematopoietic cell linker n=1 Tax=Chinchilla lanigera TaxID=34839 RepID=A0A8C2UIF3_CHILA
RTTKEGSSDLKFQNFTLPKMRSWPGVNSATGESRPPLLHTERNMTAVPDGVKLPPDDDYEDPELQMVDTWPSMKILPARPIKESEYADTRCFRGALDLRKTVLPTQTWSREGRAGCIQRVRSQLCHQPAQTLWDSSHRPPPTLPKKYQPLPPAPPESHTPSLQQHISHHQIKPESSHPLENQNAQKTPLASWLSVFPLPDYKGGTQSSCPRRCQSPTSCGPGESSLPSTHTSWRKPLPLRSAAKDIQHNEWYIGEYSRQVVEDALMQESKDGTFLVRDCSTKSTAEPYVLVVFHGNKVYNVKIRFLERNQKFALGTGLRGNEKFDSVEDIIEHYKNFPIILIDGKDKSGVHREQCYLSQPLTLARHFSPR